MNDDTERLQVLGKILADPSTEHDPNPQRAAAATLLRQSYRPTTVVEMLKMAARLQRRSDVFDTADVFNEGMRLTHAAAERVDDLAAQLQDALDSRVRLCLDPDTCSAAEDLLRRLREELREFARKYDAPKRGPGAPKSWRRHYDHLLRQVGVPRTERRRLLSPENLRKFWQEREGVRGPGGVGVVAKNPSKGVLWCHTHPDGCPIEHDDA